MTIGGSNPPPPATPRARPGFNRILQDDYGCRRHAGKANYVFADGHAQSTTPTIFAAIRTNAGGRSSSTRIAARPPLPPAASRQDANAPPAQADPQTRCGRSPGSCRDRLGHRARQQPAPHRRPERPGLVLRPERETPLRRLTRHLPARQRHRRQEGRWRPRDRRRLPRLQERSPQPAHRLPPNLHL